MERKTLRIGTRGSPLALKQSTGIQKALSGAYPHLQIDLLVIKTTGDKIQDVPLAAIGGKGLFVKEIEEALLSGTIDLAIHSMKDMPGDLPKGLKIGAVPVREDPRDILISRNRISLQDIPGQGKIGTSSLRRKAQLLYQKPDLQIVSLRGNLDTRLRKLETEGLSGIVLAAAGVHRLGLKDQISQYLDLDTCLPAVGQGALALEIREEDSWLQGLLSRIDHEATALCTQAERTFLKGLQGGCQVPIAGHAWLQNSRLVLKGLIADLEGTERITDQIEGPISDPLGLGNRLAERLFNAGGKAILDQLYGKTK